MIHKTLILFGILAFTLNLKAETHIPEDVFIETDRDIYIAGEDLYFSVFINSVAENGKVASNICYIVLRNEKNRILQFYINTKTKGTYSSFYLPDTLKTGYYEIVAFTNYMRNFGEEAYFRKQLLIVNRFDEWLGSLKHSNGPDEEDSISTAGKNSEIIKLTTGKDIFGIRKKVTLEVESTLPLSNISITVKEYNSYSANLLNHPVPTSVLPLNNGELKYEPETRGFHLYGILKKGDDPAENECLFISTPDTFANLQYTFTNRNGEFSFILGDYYQGKTTIIATRENHQGKYTITLEDKFKLTKPFVPDKKPIKAALRKYILESQNMVKVRKVYHVSYSLKENQDFENHKIPYVYREPTKVVFPSQFVVLNNFEEIANNLLTGFRIKTRNGISHGYNLNPGTGLLFENPGAVFLNGVYLYNLNDILNFSTTDINKLELCNDYRVKGSIQLEGIISVITPRQIDFAAILPGSLVTVQDKALPAITYAPPQYGSALTRDPLPDFRQTLYWRVITELKEKQSFDFYTSDWPGDYIVEVKATIPDGSRINSYKIINIRK